MTIILNLICDKKCALLKGIFALWKRLQGTYLTLRRKTFLKKAATKQNNYINVNLVLDIVLITVTIIILIITMIVLIIMIIMSNVEKYSTVTPYKLHE